jgi:hypothetical protein
MRIGVDVLKGTDARVHRLKRQIKKYMMEAVH